MNLLFMPYVGTDNVVLGMIIHNCMHKVCKSEQIAL